MAQTMILPGTYIEVRDEGLITAGGVTTGNIGVVGTANKGELDEVKLLGSFSEAKEIFGDRGQDTKNEELTLIRALELIYNNGGKTVYAVRTGNKANKASYTLTKAQTNLLKLEAKTPGTWGNAIAIEIITLKNDDDTATEEVKLVYGVTEEKYQITNVADLETQINVRLRDCRKQLNS